MDNSEFGTDYVKLLREIAYAVVHLSLTMHQEAEVFPHEQKCEFGEAHSIVLDDPPAQERQAETSCLPPAAK